MAKLTMTELMKRRAELERSQEQLHRALEGSALALWDFDLVDERIFLSEQWSVMLGQPAGEARLTARELLDLMPAEDLPRVQAALGPVLDGRSQSYEVLHRVRRSDGRLLWLHSEGRGPTSAGAALIGSCRTRPRSHFEKLAGSARSWTARSRGRAISMETVYFNDGRSGFGVGRSAP